MTVGLLEREGSSLTVNTADGDITVTFGGRRQMLPTIRPDGSVGMKRARTDAEKEMVSDLDVVLATLADPGFWAAADHLPGNTQPLLPRMGRPPKNPPWVRLLVVCLAGHFGSQRKAIAFFRSRHMWKLLRDISEKHKPAEYLSMTAEPITRWQLTRFVKQWESDDWADIRERVRKATLGSGITRARHLGHFDPDQPLSYQNPDLRQWVIADGTVMNTPSDRREGGRKDSASGMHAHAGKTRYGSKFVLAETASGEYRGRYIIGMEHVEPKPGKLQGDEGEAALKSLFEIKEQAPGLRVVVIDSVFRGVHIKRCYDAGMVVVNVPHAKENPNRKEGGRNADGRVEYTDLIRVHTHRLANGHHCKHRLHAVGSEVHEERFNEEGDTVLVPLPPPKTGYSRENVNGTYRWYLEYTVPCRYGDTTARIRIDAPGRSDNQGWSYPDRLRFYPTNTAQFPLIYGRRNATESVHHQWKTTAPRVPAYGRVRQELFVLGYIITHNAVADVFHARRAGLSTILDEP